MGRSQHGSFFHRGIALYLALAATHAHAHAQVGPGSVVGPIAVNGTSETVVGSTTVTSTGANTGVNVNGAGTAIFDTTAGPSPGPILVQTVNGNGLLAEAGEIIVPFSGLTVQTVDGHAAIANGNGSTITFANGAALSTTGTGSGLVAIGGGAVINATGVAVNNLGNAAVNVTGGTNVLAASTWSYPGDFSVKLDAEAGKTSALEVSPRAASPTPSILLGPIGGLIDASANENAGAFEMKISGSKQG